MPAGFPEHLPGGRLGQAGDQFDPTDAEPELALKMLADLPGELGGEPLEPPGIPLAADQMGDGPCSEERHAAGPASGSGEPGEPLGEGLTRLPEPASEAVGGGEEDDEFLLTGPERQGQGLGTQIIKDVLAAADRQGLAVELQVFSENPAARLYEKLGFGVTHYKMLRKPAGSGA